MFWVHQYELRSVSGFSFSGFPSEIHWDGVVPLSRQSQKPLTLALIVAHPGAPRDTPMSMRMERFAWMLQQYPSVVVFGGGALMHAKDRVIRKSHDSK